MSQDELVLRIAISFLEAIVGGMTIMAIGAGLLFILSIIVKNRF